MSEMRQQARLASKDMTQIFGDFVAEFPIQASFEEDVRFDAKFVSHHPAKSGPIERRKLATCLDLDKQVDIAVWTAIATRPRPKYRERSDAASPDLGLDAPQRFGRIVQDI
jgi:hypothetical protein